MFIIHDTSGSQLARRLFLAPPNEDTIITINGDAYRIIELDLMDNTLTVAAAD